MVLIIIFLFLTGIFNHFYSLNNEDGKEYTDLKKEFRKYDIKNKFPRNYDD